MESLTHSAFWLALFQIVSLNLVLSGDNAAVIALAARRLHGSVRRRAVILGTMVAILLRVALIFVAAELLTLPYLQTVGSLLLLWIAYRLIQPDPEPDEAGEVPELNPMEAVRAIVVADVVMSLDNVLSLAAVARGNWALLIIGLLTSIPLILVGSDLLILLVARFPASIALGGGLLGYVAGDMLVSDAAWQSVHWLGNPWIHNSVPVILAAGVIALAFRKRQ